MSDAIEQSTVVDGGSTDQGGFGSQYFNEYNQVDDNTGEDVADGDAEIKVDEDGKPIPKEGENGEVKKPDEKKADDKPVQKPAEETSEGDKNKPTTRLTEIPKGYEGQFYEKAEDGKISFNLDTAMSALLPKDREKAFKYGGRNFVAEDPNKKPDEPADPYDSRIESEQSERNSIRTNMVFWPNKYQEAINSNYTHDQAVQYANQKTQSLIDKDFSERDLQYQKDLGKLSRGSEKENNNKALLIEKTGSNLSIIENELGGREKYNELLVSGVHIINELFDMINPAFKKDHTQKEVTNELNKWWLNVTSDMNSLRFVKSLITGERSLLAKNYQNFVDNVRSGKEKETAGLKGGKTTSPSGLNRGSPSQMSSEQKSFAQYMGEEVEEI